jgi:hypothetical protein
MLLLLKSFMPKVLDGERMGMVFNMAYDIQGESRVMLKKYFRLKKAMPQ